MANPAHLSLPCRDLSYTAYDGDLLVSTFLAEFPTQLHYMKPKDIFHAWVFWNQNERSQNNSSSDDPGLLPDIPDPWIIHDKIKSCFSMLTFYHRVALIQFWAPVTIGGRQLLTTSDQPFALKYLDLDLLKYRLSFLEKKYNVDVNAVEVEDDPTIISGAPASAFLNRLGVHLESSSLLVHPPVECEPMAYAVLPICDPSRQGCVGVVECFVKKDSDSFMEYFYDLTQGLEEALQEVGLRIYRVSESVPYKNIPRLEHARDEIKDALKFICDSHGLSLAQVWIPYEDANHVPLSSCTKVTRTKRVLALKLVGHWVGSGSRYEELDEEVIGYCDSCDLVALEEGEGLIGKTLQTREPHFCTDTSKLMPVYIEDCSLFAICLRRDIQAPEFDYVFEFLWHQGRNRDIVLEELLLTLKRSFKYASSGAEPGDELRVVKVVDLSSSKTEFFKLFEGSKLSTIPEASEEGRRPVVGECIPPSNVKYNTRKISLQAEQIEQQFGFTMKKAAENIGVSLSTLKRKCKDFGIQEWQGPKFPKRMVNGLYQTGANEEENRAIQDPLFINGETNLDVNTLTIKVEYEDDVIRFDLPISLATFVAVEEEIGKRFTLKKGSYKLKYCDEDKEWILMVGDQDLEYCIKAGRLSNSNTIRLRVLPSTR